MYGQVSGGPAPHKSISYSYEFINNVMVIFEHSDETIKVFYTVQNEQKPIIDSIKNITTVSYMENDTKINLTYDDQSQVTFSTRVDPSQKNSFECIGIGYSINDEGFSKENVRKLVASWE
jgi:hypothetical protein